MKINEQLIEKLYKIPWFSNCGKEPSLQYVIQVDSKKQITKKITSIRWKNMIINNQGDITEKLCIRSCKGIGNEYQEWNDLINTFQNNYYSKLKEQWEAELRRMDLNREEVIEDISSNIRAIVMANVYREIVPIPEFFVQLLEIYESGYLPCGWKGKKDKGVFIIY